MISFCPLCQSSFRPMEAKVLEERGEKRLVHLHCGKCQNAMLALVLINKGGMSSIGLVTDLTYDDVVRLRDQRRLTTDDVLDFHQILETDGFLTRLNSSD